ncbi:MAG TPA: hypothetical protein VGC42_07125 [Kofleriaceae bacterium]
MRAAAALAAALALAGCRADASIGDASGVLFGAAAATATADEAAQEAALIALEGETGRTFDLDRIYHQWDTAVPGVREQWTLDAGRIPIVSFKASSDVPWPALARGDAEPRLAAIAAAYRALAAPVFCIFDQDPENSGGALGTPADFAAAYRHIVLAFRAAGATNVTWIFNLKSPSYPHLADQYYPGDDVIDWLGASAYNFGVASGGRWVSFADLLTDFVAWATPHGKPLIVTEWASTEDPADPARKATWITDAARAVHDLPQIRAISAYWSMVDGNRFDSSPRSLAAFQAFAQDPYTHLRDPAR